MGAENTSKLIFTLSGIVFLINYFRFGSYLRMIKLQTDSQRQYHKDDYTNFSAILT
jgi:hypothetical protein